MRYFPHLDALRAYAVLLVLIEHTMPGVWPEGGRLLPAYLGGTGVRLFFVLSGFLITEILWGVRDRAPIGVVLRAFYIRRAVRIFPLAFVVIGVAFAIGLAQQDHWFYLTYTSNWRIVLSDTLPADGLGHFWSLAVEEQFYLLWPLLILGTPRARVPEVVVASIAASLAFLIWCCVNDQPVWAYVLTPARWAALAAGGAHALGLTRGWLPRVAPSAALGLALLLWAPAAGWSNILGEVTGIVFSLWLVESAVRGWPPLVARLLAPRPITALGTIAYGVYVYHAFLVVAIPWAERTFDIWLRHPAEWGPSRFVYITLLTLAMAIPSWWWFERPINNLKRYAPYVPPQHNAAAGARAPAAAR